MGSNRVLYGRRTSRRIGTLLAVCCGAFLLASAAQAGASWQGRSSLLLLPITAQDGQPAGVGQDVTSSLLNALGQMAAVEVAELNPRSPMVARARVEADPVTAERLETGLKLAVDAAAPTIERLAGAAAMAALLHVDGVVYGKIDELTTAADAQAPQQVTVRATIVKAMIGANGEPVAVPYTATGKSRPHKKKRDERELRSEAIADLSHQLSVLLTRRQE